MRLKLKPRVQEVIQENKSEHNGEDFSARVPPSALPPAARRCRRPWGPLVLPAAMHAPPWSRHSVGCMR